MELRADFTELAAGFGVELTAPQVAKLRRYGELLIEWNEKINLTAITAPEEIEVKHFLDSLLLIAAAEVKSGASMIDVGTGAGFPSLPCKIARDDICLTMLDSLNKRIAFLNAVCAEVGVSAAAIHARAEDGGHSKALREQFDIATARAVANLRELAEYCLPFVKVGGVFAALKGGDVDDELSGAKPAIKLLGGRAEDIKKYTLPDGSRRSIVIIRKISQTPPKYPRPPAKISKNPL